MGAFTSSRRQTGECRNPGFTLVEMLVVMSIVGVLAGLLLPAIQAAREASRRTRCATNLRQLAIALQSYHSCNGAFPPGGRMHQKKAPNTGVSWRVLILQGLEQANLYDFIAPSVNGGWTNDGEMPDVFRCPSIDLAPGSVPSSYWGISGVPKDGETKGQADPACGLMAVNGAFFADSKTRISNITDGTSATLAVGERDYLWRNWMGGAQWFPSGPQNSICSEAANNFVYPINASHAQFGYYIGDNSRPPGTTAEIPLNNLHFGSRHPGGAHFACADGSVHFFSDATDLTLLQEMATIAGDEVNRSAY